MMSVDAYLQQVRRGLAGMDPTVREDVVRELRSHLTDSVAANGGNVDVAVAALGDPAAVARRYRELYGYGLEYRIAFAAIAVVLAVLTVPVLFSTGEALFPYALSTVFLTAELGFLMWFSVRAGSRAGVHTGLAALVGRMAAFGAAFLAQRAQAIVTADGLALFLVVSVLLVAVGWVPGRAKQVWRRPGAEL